MLSLKNLRNALTKDVFDTVCSFNNRNGGHILLGVNDKREIIGVSKDRVDKVIKEFTTAINNPQKMYPPLYLLPEVFDIDEKKVIYIKVPEGYQVCRHNGRIWDRSYEGDIKKTILNLYISYTQENKEVILLIKYIRISILIFLMLLLLIRLRKWLFPEIKIMFGKI